MSHSDRHNRQDGQIENLRNFQIFLQVVAGTALVAAIVAIAIYANRLGFAGLWKAVSPYLLPCCAIPAAVAVVLWLIVWRLSWDSRSKETTTPEVPPTETPPSK